MFSGALYKGWDAALGRGIRYRTSNLAKLSKLFSCSSSIPRHLEELRRPVSRTEPLSLVLNSFKNLPQLLLHWIGWIYVTFHLFLLCFSPAGCFPLAWVVLQVEGCTSIDAFGTRSSFLCQATGMCISASSQQVVFLLPFPDQSLAFVSLPSQAVVMCAALLFFLEEEGCIIFTIQTMDMARCRQHGLCVLFF